MILNIMYKIIFESKYKFYYNRRYLYIKLNIIYIKYFGFIDFRDYDYYDYL